jgi:hypothetical protein
MQDRNIAGLVRSARGHQNGYYMPLALQSNHMSHSSGAKCVSGAIRTSCVSYTTLVTRVRELVNLLRDLVAEPLHLLQRQGSAMLVGIPIVIKPLPPAVSFALLTTLMHPDLKQLGSILQIALYGTNYLRPNKDYKPLWLASSLLIVCVGREDLPKDILCLNHRSSIPTRKHTGSAS